MFSSFLVCLVSCLFLVKLKCSTVVTEEDISDLFFDDSGAWLMLRKFVIGVDNKFGVSYNFKVRYQIRNIGTQLATNITIEDTWDWSLFKAVNFETEDGTIVFRHTKLEIDETFTFEIELCPLSPVNKYFPARANVSYFSAAAMTIENLNKMSEMSEISEISDLMDNDDTDKIFGESSNYIVSIDYLQLAHQTSYLSQMGIMSSYSASLSSSVYSSVSASSSLHSSLFSSSKQNLNQDALNAWMTNYEQLYHLQVFSASIYARSIGSKIVHWLVFLVICVVVVVYPLCMFDKSRGNIATDMSLFRISNVGLHYIQPIIKTINFKLLPQMKGYLYEHILHSKSGTSNNQPQSQSQKTK